jgi:endonuclease-3
LSEKGKKKRSTSDDRKAHAKKIWQRLDKTYPRATTALEHRSPFELLVSAILSAQCTDERVNIVTKALFKKYRGPEDYLAVPTEELEQDIRPTGFFRNKAKSLRGLSQALIQNHEGQVPKTIDEMVKLPGVGRKTANVVLGTAYGLATGVVVDTHVRRLAFRMGLTKETDPEKIERDLMALLPSDIWIDFSHVTIWHGRRVCVARKPKCSECVIADLCPRAGVKMSA